MRSAFLTFAAAALGAAAAQTTGNGTLVWQQDVEVSFPFGSCFYRRSDIAASHPAVRQIFRRSDGLTTDASRFCSKIRVDAG